MDRRQLLILGIVFVVGAVALVWLTSSLRREQRRYLQIVVGLCRGRLEVVTWSSRADYVLLVARHAGRQVSIALQIMKVLQQPTLWIACSSTTYFSLGTEDIPQSFTSQLRDPEAREAVRRFIQQHSIGNVSIDSDLPPEEKRSTFPPGTIANIIADAVQLAGILERRDTASHV